MRFNNERFGFAVGIALLAARRGGGFTFESNGRRWRKSGPPQKFSLSSSSSPFSWNDEYAKLQKLKDDQIFSDLTNALILGDAAGSASLLPIELRGQGKLPVQSTSPSRRNETQLVLFFGAENRGDESQPCIVLPLDNPSQLKLVSFAQKQRKLSKSIMLELNTALVNRDNSLFDNLPWAQWSVDPKLRNRDAANNPIADKFHLGKRDAYNRFLGKDWQGRSAAIGNMALRLKYFLEAEEKDEDNNGSFSSDVLTQRILEMEIKELEMQVAETESDLAVARQNDSTETEELLDKRARLREKIEQERSVLGDLLNPNPKTKAAESLVETILQNVADWSTSYGENEAPYRGAAGYAPRLDSKQDIEDSHLPYTNPYDLLREILEDQLNARIIGSVLEQTSLLEGNIALGGAVILQRIVPKKDITLAGESVTIDDTEEDFGNVIQGGEAIVVECDGDEAVGISLALNVPLKLEPEIWEAATVMAEQSACTPKESNNIWETIPVWKTLDNEMLLGIEGNDQISAAESPISIPRTTSSMFDSVDGGNENPNAPMFPTDNPIKTLAEYDELSDSKKAKTLLELSNFNGRLPRPRVVRNAKVNPLDQLLVPLIDESVRNQYQLREAERQGDTQRVEELKNRKSARQVAKEKAEVAREMGLDDEAFRWEREAELLEGLRADVTQDEGSYSRFLDRDDWYERNRQATAKRAKRSSFGTLLDGIE